MLKTPVTGAYVLDAATQAMIAALDSQEDRDRLTRFLTVELQDGKGTGIEGQSLLHGKIAREADIIKILRKVTQVPVTVIDPQAHMNKIILSAMAKVDFPKFAAQAKARATVLIFPIDEISDMEDISETVDTLGDTVDWVIVRNPERIPTTKFFDGSLLEQQLSSYHAASLEIPSLMTDTRNHLRGIQVKLRRAISPAEAIANADLGLDMVHLMVLEKWLAEMFRRFHAIKSYLVPNFYAEKIQAPGDIRKPRERTVAAVINLENIPARDSFRSASRPLGTCC